jgi:hypothetical protein
MHYALYSYTITPAAGTVEHALHFQYSTIQYSTIQYTPHTDLCIARYRRLLIDCTTIHSLHTLYRYSTACTTHYTHALSCRYSTACTTHYTACTMHYTACTIQHALCTILIHYSTAGTGAYVSDKTAYDEPGEYESGGGE